MSKRGKAAAAAAAPAPPAAAARRRRQPAAAAAAAAAAAPAAAAAAPAAGSKRRGRGAAEAAKQHQKEEAENGQLSIDDLELSSSDDDDDSGDGSGDGGDSPQSSSDADADGSDEGARGGGGNSLSSGSAGSEDLMDDDEDEDDDDDDDEDEGEGGSSDGADDDAANEAEQDIRDAIAEYMAAAQQQQQQQQQRAEGGVQEQQQKQKQKKGAAAAAGKKQQQQKKKQQQQQQQQKEDDDDGDDEAASGSGSEEGEEEAGTAAGGKAAAAAAAGGSDDDDDDGAAARPPDPGSDSSEDEERPNRNTIGDVPLEWYAHEEHIGYDASGRRLAKTPRGDRLDALLARADADGAPRTVYDAYNDEEVTLSREELALVMRLRRGHFPHAEVDAFPEYIDYYSGDVDPTPLLNAPEPKRRFVPSKWEEQKIVKLVRAIRKGWLAVGKPGRRRRQPYTHADVWADELDGGVAASTKTGAGLTYIPPAKPKLPGHEESYNPPPEYLPTEEDLAGHALLPPEERPTFVPRRFDCLRRVPAYERFIQERFERCLDLYLCPRVRKKRLFVRDPSELLPQLPKPAELRPFPTALAVEYVGHAGRVRSVSPHPGGQWLASGGDDGAVRLWEVATGRCCAVWQLGGPGVPVVCVAWCPNLELQLLAAAVGSTVVLLPSGLGGDAAAAAARAACSVPAAAAASADEPAPLARWTARGEEGDGGLEIRTGFPVTHLAWHGRGDYFATASPAGATKSVLVHQLSKRATQNPFRKNRGRVARVAFHPLKPFFFVATQNAVRVYNLAKQALAKKLVAGSGAVTALAVHPSGDHLIVGAEDKRLAWYDLDLGATPYRSLKYHAKGVRGAAFHSRYPLFASVADDGAAHVFHGRVFADLGTDPLIVPVRILRPAAHQQKQQKQQQQVEQQQQQQQQGKGLTDCAFHPTQPWLFTAGADGRVLLWSS